MNIVYRDRESGALEIEKVYGKLFLEALYGKSWLSKIFSLLVLPLITHFPLFSKLYGKRQKSLKSQAKILPFIEEFGVHAEEFKDPVETFQSFNDFFIRKLRPESRPITPGSEVAIFPGDGRYFVYPDVSQVEGFYVKGKKFDLRRLLRDDSLFEKYEKGGLVIGRLCPTDYHRFHFPCACIPSSPKPIKGPLYSVNPIALKDHIHILNENKRVLTQLKTDHFGDVLFIEVGATFVGSIKQTYTPQEPHEKGAEKGYFEFGGSCLMLLFEPNTIVFDRDLVETSKQNIETKAKFGTSLGRCK